MHWWNIQRLKSKNPQTRRAIVEKVAEHPSAEDLQLLVPLLRDVDGSVRKATARALGSIRDRQAVAHLVQLLSDPIAEVRESAVVALRKIGDTEAASSLIKMLKDNDPGVRSQAANALERFGWKPQNTEERTLRDAALGHFVNAVQAGLPVFEVLTKSLAQGTATIKREAIEALGHIGGEEAIPPLLAAVRDGDFTVRVAALEALREVAHPRAFDLIIGCLKHSEPSVRASAAAALGSYGANAVPALVTALNDANWSVRTTVVEALGRTKDVRLADTLAPLLKDPDHDVREATCKALGSIRDARAVTALALSLIDSQSSVRETAAIALRDIDAEWERFPEAQAALPHLKQALNDREYWVRHAARDTIQRIEAAAQSTPGVSLMDEKLDAALGVLISLLKHPQRDLRQAAAEALGRFQNPQLASFLTEAGQDEDRWVRAAVEQALQRTATNARQEMATPNTWGAAA